MDINKIRKFIKISGNDEDHVKYIKTVLSERLTMDELHLGTLVNRKCPNCGSENMYCNWEYRDENKWESVGYYHDYFWHICPVCFFIEHKSERNKKDYNIQDELIDPTNCPICGRKLGENV